ncbi:MAG: class I tRNA ligase family protein, partial [Actinobacteria bacterium]|nr:class I tRNA ligase family protein [Actinomycetota bacterium]
EFAKKYNIPIIEVISEDGKSHGQLNSAYVEDGIMINSGPFNGLSADSGRKEVTSYLEKNKIGRSDVNYKLKDWLISRQRYWGAPIPIIYCEKCGTVPVAEDDLPVLLPYNIDFKPTGLSPLSYCEEFVRTKCPKCGGEAKRETDTMDTFVCSSWYFLRYCSPHFEAEAFDREEVKYWMPVDQYIGGIEHATMHLIYSRFFTKVLYDADLVNFREPFTRYYPHGVVTLGGQKMSKSKGNIVNPSEIYNKYGADTLRLYILFIGPADSIVDWSDSGVEGSSRFLKRFWRIVFDNIEYIKLYKKRISGTSSSVFPGGDEVGTKLKDLFNTKQLPEIEKELYRKLHQTIKKVTSDIMERFNFNTAISAIMEMVNLMYKYDEEVQSDNKNPLLAYEVSKKLLLLISPIAPFIAEELWSKMGEKGSIHRQAWPKFESEIAKDELVTVIFQVNGKLRDRAEVSAGLSKEEIEKMAMNSEKIKRFIEDREVIKIISVPGKLVNIVIR